MKKNNSTLILTTLVCLLPIVLSIVMYPSLPAEIPIHFDVNGTPNNYLPKAIAAFGIPIFMAIINFVCNFFMRNDPNHDRHAKSMVFFTAWILPIMSLILMPITLFISIGIDIPIEIVAPALVGAILVFCGNYLPKSKQNYTIGIKLPWTLASEENWNKTHRFAGYLWVVGGILFIALSFLNPQVYILQFLIIVIMVALPVIYSYSMYKKSL